MCWQSQELKEKRSNGKVKVFKICYFKKDQIKAYFFYDFSYKLNEIYQTNVRINKKYDEFYDYFVYIGTQGFHSYSADYCNVTKNIWTFVVKPNTNGDRVESYPVPRNETLVVVEGYIPKDGVYYENEKGEIISDKIILTEIIDILNFPKELYL